MKQVNNKPTVILCFEDFIKSCIIAEKGAVNKLGFFFKFVLDNLFWLIYD